MKMKGKIKVGIIFAFMVLAGLISVGAGLFLAMEPKRTEIWLGCTSVVIGLGLLYCAFRFLPYGLKEAKIVDARREATT